MRTTILNRLFERMAVDKTLFWLCGDMGLGIIERFRDTYPDRFLNVGIAEQSLIGTAAGLHNAGFRPVIYTISTFLVHRAFEQLRNDIALHKIPIIMLGSTVGFDTAPLGMSHQILDDWGALKVLPEFQIHTPWSTKGADRIITDLLDNLLASPTYIRIPKGSPKHDFHFRDASKPIALVSYGPLLEECLKVQALRPDVTVIEMSHHHPIDKVPTWLLDHRRTLVVEDHFADSGLYGSLATLCLRHNLHVRLESVAPPHAYPLLSGARPKWFWRRFGLDAQGIIQQIERPQ